MACAFCRYVKKGKGEVTVMMLYYSCNDFQKEELLRRLIPPRPHIVQHSGGVGVGLVDLK